MRVLDYRLCTRAALEAAQTHAQEVAVGWCGDWLGVATAAASCAVTPLSPGRRADLTGACRQAEGRWGRVWMREDVQALSAMVFGSGPRGSGEMAEVLVRRAQQQLLSRLAGSEGGLSDLPAWPADMRQPGRALMLLRLVQPTQEVELVLEPARPVATALQRKGASPPVRPETALLRQGLRMDVRLASAEVELGALQDLAVGDVLRLDAGLQDGAQLWVAGNRLPCQGYPGTVRGRAAIEIGR
jgi:hypothetical protein